MSVLFSTFLTRDVLKFQVISLPSFIAGIYDNQLFWMPMCAIIFRLYIWNPMICGDLLRLYLLQDRYMGSPDLWEKTTVF